MRVVIATDGSIEADLAETVFLKLPLPEDARFTVAMATHLPIHAAPAFTPEGLSYSDKVAADTWRIQHQVARRTAESVAARIRTRGFEAEARVVGARIVALEEELDAIFARGEADAGRLAALTAALGALGGRLREAHLAAHIGMREALSPDQRATYAKLRGYAPR